MSDIEENESNDTLEFFLKTLWDKRADGINISTKDLFEPVTAENIEYLINLYPFLQIINPDATFEEEAKLKLITAKNGWIIHDYGDAMSSSLGQFLYSANEYHKLPFVYGEEDADEDEGGDSGEGGEGDASLKPIGTVINQAFNVAQEMVELVHQKGWPGITIIAGTPLMEWAAWLAAEKFGITILGYEPNENDIRKQSRLSGAAKQKQLKA